MYIDDDMALCIAKAFLAHETETKSRKEYEAMKLRILAYAEKVQDKILETDEYVVTILPRQRVDIDRKLLEAEFEEAFRRCASVSSHQQMKIVKR